jgi:hypothetical protein
MSRRSLTDFTLCQAPILSVAAAGAVLGGTVSLAVGSVCWEIFLVVLVVVAISPLIGRA